MKHSAAPSRPGPANIVGEATGGWTDYTRQKLCASLIENAPAGPLVESHLRAAILEVCAAPGKLVRARLAFATMKAHGSDSDTAIMVATAVEYYHLSSLLLDDLPCMDDAVTRRGRPCTHRVHGEATAILAALAFINRAYALIGFALGSLPRAVRLQAHACLDACLGTNGLVGGQAGDLRFAESDRSAREVGHIAARKTGAMFWLGLLFPALLSAPGKEERSALQALCLYWGLAFQALDDVQDVLSTPVEAGKTTGRDRALTRPNLAVAIGLPAARGRITRLLAQAGTRVERLIEERPAWSYLREFQRYFVSAAEPILGEARVAAA